MTKILTVSWLIWGMLLLGACSEPAHKGPSDVLTLDGQGFSLSFDLRDGLFQVVRDDGVKVLHNAFCEVGLWQEGNLEPVAFRSSNRYQRVGKVESVDDALGRGRRIEVTLSGLADAPDLTLRLSVYEGTSFFTASLEASNTGAQDFLLARLVPAKVDGTRSGGLWLGGHPSRHRILDAGAFFLFDFFVDLVPGDVAEPVETVALGMVHGYQQGHSISNWNHAIYDLDSGRAFVAGALDFNLSGPMFNASFDPENATESDGRTPFTLWSGEFPFLPNGKPLPAGGEPVAIGPMWVTPWSAEPLAALEGYAQAVKDWNQIALWPERGEEHRVPTGWNSWTGSGSSGGYGSGIDQQLMIDNLAAMDEQFKDFGGEWYQIDDGYEYHYGDWDWREDRFPDGSAWMADQIEQRGLIPGVWIAAFQVSANSQTYAQHEADGWFPETLPFMGGGSPVLDLTHPEVQAWLTDRFRQIRAHGYRWLKTDFSYWALGAKTFYDPTVTREEAYRLGLQAIKDGLDLGAIDAGGAPGDTFWVSVSMIGPHVGFTDSVRPNLDTMPAWDREGPDQDRKEAQGFKPTVRSIARRYYLQNRVYIFNHDMLFFRSHSDESVARITRAEARCLLSAVALSGSVSKLGEKIVDMEPEWIQDYRTSIPVYGHGARPLDLFLREYPEKWHLHVDPAQGLNTGGVGPAYDVVGLFNWGTNDDLSTNPYSPMPDEARELEVALSDVGLDPGLDYVARDMWSGEVIYPLRESIKRTIAPHTVQLFAIRPALDRPHYIGGNRHLLQGAVEFRDISWSADGVLSLTYDAAPGSTKAPFEHELVFRIPPGWSMTDVVVPGSDGSAEVSPDGSLLSVRFTVSVRQDVAIQLTFSES